MSEFDTDVQCEEVYGTFKGEPASEDGWPTEWNEGAAIGEGSMTPAQEFDILFGYVFGYAEERHCNDPCAHPAPKN